MTTLAVPFDTLAFVKELETAGVPAPQAEAQARALSNVLQKVDENRSRELATKGELVEIKGDIAEFRAEMKGELNEIRRDMRELELRMIIKLGAMIILAVGVIMTSLRIWPIPVQPMPLSAQHVQEMRAPVAP